MSHRLPRKSLSFSVHESARVCRLEILYHPEHRLHAFGYFDLGTRASHFYTNITGVHCKLVKCRTCLDPARAHRNGD